MILYMLKQVKFPLSNSQISEFFLDNEYTTFFTLQQALNELLEAHLIKKETSRNITIYEISREGEETLSFFGEDISTAIIDDMNQYLAENKVRLRDEVGIIADYYKATNQDYIVHCEIREGKSKILSFDVSVPLKSQAEKMCKQFRDSSQSIYAFILKELMKEQ